MPFPQFYHPEQVGTLYIPNTSQAIAEGMALRLPPSAQDSPRILLLLVDAQVDFIHTDGALSVPGAVGDTRRTIEWIFEHVGQISDIAASLDSHIPTQIFYPTWWVDAEGHTPAPFTAITSQEVQAGKWRPVYEAAWSVEYVERLEQQAKKALMIWPYHTMIGTPGHTLTPALYEAIVYHAAARQTTPHFLAKGSIPKTEHYSILEPEVKVNDHPQGGLNTEFLEMLTTYDIIYIAGQAKSHCVLETVSSMMRYFGKQTGMIDKLRVLMDCTSSVAHPEIDFDAIAESALGEFASQGLYLVQSSDSIS